MSTSKSSTAELRLIVVDAYSEVYSVGETLVVNLAEELRYLPARRKVAQAFCNGREILVKVFFPHRKQERDVRREWASSRLLYGNGVTSPKPLILGRTEDGRLVVAYEFISQAEVLNEVICNGGEAIQQECLTQLIETQIKEYELGVYQSDNHLANYLWRDELFVIDAGSILIRKAPLRMSLRADNMAQLLAAMPFFLRVKMIQEMRGNSAWTTSCENWIGFLEKVVKRLPEAIQRRRDRYFRKTRRSSEEFLHKKEEGGGWHAWRGMPKKEREGFIADPEGFALTRAGRGYKLRRFLKQPKISSLIKGGKVESALNEWSVAHLLIMLGIPTARPVLCICGRDFDYLVLERIETRALSDCLDRKQIAKKLAHRFSELESMGGDYRAMDEMSFFLNRAGDLMMAPRGLKLVKPAKRGGSVEYTKMMPFVKNMDSRDHEEFLSWMLAEIDLLSDLT